MITKGQWATVFTDQIAGRRHCARCGGELHRFARIDAVYCSDRCRSASNRGRRKSETPRNATCGQCGDALTASRADARYCSTRCRVAAHRQRRA